MKKLIITILLSLFVFLISHGQEIGSPNTTVYVKGAFSVDSSLTLPQDTLLSAPVGSIGFKGDTLYLKTADEYWKAIAYTRQLGSGSSTTIIPLDPATNIYFVKDSTNTPPVSTPADSSYYLLGNAPTGAWTGQANKIAIYIVDSGGYVFRSGVTNDYAITLDDFLYHQFNGTTWPIASAVPVLIGGNIGPIKVGTINNSYWDLISNNSVRVRLLADGTIRFPGYGKSSKTLIAAMTTNGYLRNTFVGTGLTFDGDTLKATVTNSSTDNSNVGLGFRPLKPATQEIKTLFNSYAINWDSTTNTNGLTPKLDTSLIMTRASGVKLADSLGALIGTGSGSSVNVYAPLVQSGDTISMRFNVLHYGADNTGVADATAAIQAAINDAMNTIAGNSAYRAIIYFPLGKYLIAGSLVTLTPTGDTVNKGQLYIPYTAFDSSYKMGHIVLMGEVPPSDFTTRGVFTLTPPTNGVTLITNKKVVGYILAGAYRQSFPYNMTYNEVSIENINFRVASKSVTNTDTIPVMGAVDGYNIAMMRVNNCRFDTESPSGTSMQPAISCIALRMPHDNNWTQASITNTTINNYYTGIVASEHTQGTNVFIGTCYNGIEIMAGSHGIHFDRILLVWNVNHIFINGFSYFSFDQVDFEDFTTFEATKWYNFQYHIYEPTPTSSEGQIHYIATQSAVGHINSLVVSSNISPKVMYAPIPSVSAWMLSVGNTHEARKKVDIIGAQGKLPFFPATTGSTDNVLIENNSSNYITQVVPSGQTAGFKVLRADGSDFSGKLEYQCGSGQWVMVTGAGSYNYIWDNSGNSYSPVSFQTNTSLLGNGFLGVGAQTRAGSEAVHIRGGDGAVTPVSLGTRDVIFLENNNNANFSWAAGASSVSQFKFWKPGGTVPAGSFAYDNALDQMRFGVNTTNAFDHSDFMIGSNHGIGIGTDATNPVASALVEMVSTTKGLLLPRMTTTQRDAISSPATGLTIYNTTTNLLNFYNGSAWTALGTGVGGSGDLVSTNNLSDVASASTARTNLGLAIGTNVQAYDADLTTYAGITPASNVQSILGAANYAAVKTLLTLNNVDNTSDATKNSATATFTGKTISGGSNTITNIANASLSNSTVTINNTSVALGGSIDTRPLSAFVTGSDFTTTSATAVDITGLSIAVGASKKYRITVSLSIGCSGANGVKLAMTAPTGSTWSSGGWVGSAGSAITAKSVKQTAFATLSATAFNTSIDANGFVTLTGYFTTSVTTGNIVVQVASNTATQVSTVFIGSGFDIIEVQ